MGELHRIRVKSSYKLTNIVDIKIENKPNEHGHLYLKCLIDDSINFKATINSSTDDKICVYEELEDKNEISTSYTNSFVNINEVDIRNSKVIFYGIVQSVSTTNTDGVYYIEIEACTSSFDLDIKEKTRSFQNINITYEGLIGEILKGYPGYKFTQCIGSGLAIGKPVFQYRETDWNFIKRIASELNLELYSDAKSINNVFHFGIPGGHSYTLKNDLNYKASKDLKKFNEVGGYEKGYHDTDYFYYEVKTREHFEVGSEVNFKQKQLYIREYKAYADRAEIIYKYKLCRKKSIWQNRISNEYLQGLSLKGKVLDVKGELVKLHLDIDDGQNQDEAAWFRYAPATGDTMYSMPVIGTSVSLYFSNKNTGVPIITGCVRENGCSCEKTSDPNNRYLGTEHGSEIEITPSAIRIKGGSEESIGISLDDDIGIIITSPKKISLSAEEEIIIKSLKSIKLDAQNQIFIAKKDTKNALSIENEFHFLSDNLKLDGRSRETFGICREGSESIQKAEYSGDKVAGAVPTNGSDVGTETKRADVLDGATVKSTKAKDGTYSNPEVETKKGSVEVTASAVDETIAGDDNSLFKVKVAVAKGKAKAEAKAGLYEDGKLDPRLKIGVEEEFKTIEFAGEMDKIGNNMLGLEAEVSTSMYSEKAQLGIDIGKDEDTGKINCKATAGAMASLHSAKAEEKFTILGLEIGFEEEGYVGAIGATAEAGIDNGKVKFKVKAAALLGLGFGVSVGFAD
ncbi:MAG: hypothetical protein AB6733_24425 [Clostridiaceae bacterium]